MGLFGKPTAPSLEGPSSGQELPFLALRNFIVFPGQNLPLATSKKNEQAIVEMALNGSRRLVLGFYDNSQKEEVLLPLGLEVRILQVIKLPNSLGRVVLEGLERVHILEVLDKDEHARVRFLPIEESISIDENISGLLRALKEGFENYSKLNPRLPREILQKLRTMESPQRISDLVLASINCPLEDKRRLFLEADLARKIEETAILLDTESEILQLKKSINDRVKKRLEENQREFFISEQIKELNRELGKDEDDPNGLKELEERLASKSLPEEAEKKAGAELKRLTKLQAMSPEAGILRTYIEWILDLEWARPLDQLAAEQDDDANTRSNSEIPDLTAAEKILEEDHFGLEEAKERILDFIAVSGRTKRVRSPILCLVGPPGTGKTSLARSLARAMGREYVRISLGGLRDEAEIRGHRRTYVGALPGKIIQGMKRASSTSPVFLLDEIDKISADHRGDPAAALLEVLDPEQNSNFVDHYLEIPYDLSQVVFITTANSLHSIPYPLRDRMEVIQIPGYTENEKKVIAERFLIPRQAEAHGLSLEEFRFSAEALRMLIDRYTMESGVRSLERELAKAIRKVVRTLAAEPDRKLPIRVSANNLNKFLGRPRLQKDLFFSEPAAGLANGMAWTELGGKLLPVETTYFAGKGNLVLTGSLGEVMKESARIALTLLRHQAPGLGLTGLDFDKIDIHVHVPAGAIPKDGPSAGVALSASMFSALSSQAIRTSLAMTGEITLTGRILPVGGIKEKLLAAHRNGIREILIPKENEPDLEDIPGDILAELKVFFLKSFEDLISAIRLQKDLP